YGSDVHHLPLRKVIQKQGAAFSPKGGSRSHAPPAPFLQNPDPRWFTLLRIDAHECHPEQRRSPRARRAYRKRDHDAGLLPAFAERVNGGMQPVVESESGGAL